MAHFYKQDGTEIVAGTDAEITAIWETEFNAASLKTIWDTVGDSHVHTRYTGLESCPWKTTVDGGVDYHGYRKVLETEADAITEHARVKGVIEIGGTL